MIANYHTHTPRCNHAVGGEEEYVRCALEAGLQTLGFADHTPYPFPKEHYSHFRMRVEEISEYTNAVRAAQKAYGDQIRIHLGVEAEFYPRYFPEMVKILQDHGVEYMLLGQHFLYNEMEGVGSNGPTADEALLRQYCDQTIEAMHTGLFTYFAHPDLMHFVGEEAAYRRQIRRLCQAAKACQMPLEVNLLGIHLQRHYPNQRFWEIAAEEGNVVILGTDAHDPRSFLDPEPERKAREMIARLGLELLEDMPLRRI
jgi:histidinol-phosphatase (PHP family)